MSCETAIRAQNVSKCYQIFDKPWHRLVQLLVGERRTLSREFWALRDVFFDVGRGETVGIIGRNGSGKSTLLQLLCGTLSPTSGAVEINGRVAALLELGAGFNPEFTGRENVYFNATILGLTPNQIEERFSAIEDFAEIGTFIDQPVRTYSSGMYVRLAFSVAVHTDPGILIVDEALSVGDARFQAKCLNHIKHMKEQGVSILFVSHDIGAVRNLCDRVIWLDAGKVRLSGDVLPVTAQYMEYLLGDAPPASLSANPTEARTTNGQSESSVRKPINHWGTHVGSILRAGVYDVQGNQKRVFVDNEAIQVRIQFRSPPKASRSSLGVSFSFKDITGTDLIVGSTWHDKSVVFYEDRDVFEVRFDLENCLNSGEYLLTAGLEDRSAATIQYYEYIEGAQYFSSLFHGNRHGQFLPRIKQSVSTQ